MVHKYFNNNRYRVLGHSVVWLWCLINRKTALTNATVPSPRPALV